MRYTALIILFFIISCSSNKSVKFKPRPTPYSLPSSSERTQATNSLNPDLTRYYEFSKDYPHADSPPQTQIVVLALTGGPVKDPITDYFPEKLHESFQTIYVKQAFQLSDEEDGIDRTFLAGSKRITPLQARKAVIKSAAILDKLIKHFQSQNRLVYIVGHSYGAFLYPYTLASYGTQVDKAILLGGRLKFEREFIKNFQVGIDACFTFTGSTPVIETDFPPCISSSGADENDPNYEIHKYNEALLQAAIGTVDYTRELRNVETLKNILYLSGQKDQAVGPLTTEEQNFLTDKQAQFRVTANGTHSSVINIFNKFPFEEGTEMEKLAFKFLNDPLDKGPDITQVSGTVMSLYHDDSLGLADQGASKKDTFDIGIVFEGKDVDLSVIRHKLNSFFGNGKFSLFKTPVFKNHKSKFRIFYGHATSLPTAINTFALNEAQKSELRYLNPSLWTREPQTVDEFQRKIASGFPKGATAQPISYFDIFQIKEFEDGNLGENGEKAPCSEACLSAYTHYKQMEAVFEANREKEFDLKIYVSDGVQGGYARSGFNEIYLPLLDTSLIHTLANAYAEEAFAKTAVHEIGHILGDLVDEYYTYEVNESPTSLSDLNPGSDRKSFSNNCFEYYPDQAQLPINSPQIVMTPVILDASTKPSNPVTKDNVGTVWPGISLLGDEFSLDVVNNPWKKTYVYRDITDTVTLESNSPIAGYSDTLIAGCNGNKSFRATENSIMNGYFVFDESRWASHEAWGPVNSYYLNRTLNKIQKIRNNEKSIFFNKRYNLFNENDDTVMVTLTRTGDISEAATAQVTTNNSEKVSTGAVSGTDFMPIASQTVTFLAGEREANVSLTILDNALTTAPELFDIKKFFLVIEDVSPGYEIGFVGEALIEIKDDE